MSVSPHVGESPGGWRRVVPAQRSQGCPGKGWRQALPGLRAACAQLARPSPDHLVLGTQVEVLGSVPRKLFKCTSEFAHSWASCRDPRSL